MNQGVIYRIRDWDVDPAACLVSRNGDSVHLEPKVMDLLVFLARKPGIVLSRDELLDEIWPGVVVSDEALTNAIIKLRKAFNDSARKPRFIETLPKRGYRLIAEVQNVGEDAQPFSHEAPGPENPEPTPRLSASRWLQLVAVLTIVAAVGAYLLIEHQLDPIAEPVPQTAFAEKPSIAVLPFLNIGNNIEDSYFSDGITDDLITDLSSVSGLFVISRNSTFQYKGQVVDTKKVAAALGVRYILEGSVRRNGNQVRVNTQLIDGQSGGQVWAERYDGDMKDVFALQDAMTEKIIGALAITLTEREDQLIHRIETNSIEAYNEILKGAQLHRILSRDSYALAENHYIKALEYDPKYSRAHAALAALYIQTWLENWHLNAATHTAGWSRARSHLESAMENPNAQVYSLRATVQLLNRRFDTALEDARTAVSLNQNSAAGYHALAEVLSYTGESEQAIKVAEEAMQLDPKYPAPYLLVKGRALFDLQQYQQAIATLEEAVNANPADYRPRAILVANLGHAGDRSSAQVQLRKLNELRKLDQLPELTLDVMKNKSPYQNRESLDHLIAGLAKGGIPEW